MEFCAASPTLWGAEEIVNGMGGFDLLDDWCEIRRFCEYKFKTAKSSSNSWDLRLFFGTGVMPIGTPVSLGYTLVGFRRVMLLVRGVVV